jgi:hypothetical protein
MSPTESSKFVLVLIWVSNTGTNRIAVLSAEARTVCGIGPDGPWPGRRSDSSSAYICTVHTWGSDGPRWRRVSSSSQHT